jgi:hypothetical protein
MIKFADYFSKAEFLQWLGCKVKNTWTGLVQVFFFCCLNSLGVWKGRRENCVKWWNKVFMVF